MSISLWEEYSSSFGERVGNSRMDPNFWATDQRHPLLGGKDLAVAGAPWDSSAFSFDLKVKSKQL